MLSVVFAVLICVYIFYLLSSKPRGYPPGPFRVPLIGYLPWIDRKLPYRTWDKLRKQHGNVLGIYLGTQRTVVIGGWEAVKEALMNDDLNDRPDNLFFRDLFDNQLLGVMFVNGEFWKVQRRFSLFHLKNLGFGKKSHEAVIHDELKDVVQDIKDKNQKPFNIQNILATSGINILWAIVGGERFSRKDEELNMLVHLIYKSFREGQTFGVVDVFPFIRHIIPNLKYNNVVNYARTIVEFLKVKVNEHKETLDPNNPRDFIDVFLGEMSKTGADKSFTEPQLLALCSNFFVAGAETTASFLIFAIMFLCLHPDVQKKIHKEIDEVVEKDRFPSLNDKTKLIYNEAFLQEVMRIRCPAPEAVPHWSAKDTTVQGYRIPKDTLIIINLRSVLMDKDYWGDPEVFRPERFIENGTLKTSERAIAFGKGRRVCIGESLARMTSFLSFTALLQNFSFSFPPGETVEDTEGSFGFTLGPSPFNIIATPR